MFPKKPSSNGSCVCLVSMYRFFAFKRPPLSCRRRRREIVTKPSSSTRERTRTSQSRRRRRRRHVFSARGICRETALVARRRRVRGASGKVFVLEKKNSHVFSSQLCVFAGMNGMHVSFFPRSFFAPQQHDLNVPFSLLFLSQMYASSTTQTLSKSFSMFDAKYSEEMPLGNVAKSIGSSFGPALDAIEEEYSRRGKLKQQQQQLKNEDIYVPKIPHALPITRMAKDSAFLRDVLIYDEKKKVKPRLSWYDPYDKTWVPNNWFQDGLAADMKYYFGGNEAGDAAVNGRT